MNKIGAIIVLGFLALFLWSLPSAAAVDREKLLSDPGVYATFAVFKVDESWWKLDKMSRESSIAEVKDIFKKHAEKVITDLYLLRGLMEMSDFIVRLHSMEMVNNQDFLVDLMGSTFGKHLQNTHTFNGMTKKANYVPGFADELKTKLKTQSDPGAKIYAIIMPIRKDAEWWITAHDARAAMMKEHTEAAIPFLKTVKRKLYHASGLDDLDFITYFETAKLDDFNNLIIALEQVKENSHNKQFGSPTLLGTIRPIDEILNIFAR